MKKRLLMVSIFIVGLAILLSWNCKKSSEVKDSGDNNDGSSVFQLTSTAFEDGGKIPVKYTCNGEDISPPLSWINVPTNTQSFVLIMDDIDAYGGPWSVWTHWVLYNIPSNIRSLPEDANANLPAGILVGLNSWLITEYGGPCPIGTHHYYFNLYALDTILNLNAGASVDDVISAMEGHKIGVATLMGLYE